MGRFIKIKDQRSASSKAAMADVASRGSLSSRDREIGAKGGDVGGMMADWDWGRAGEQMEEGVEVA